MDDGTRYWGETDWHARGLPTPEEIALENKLLSLIFPLMLKDVQPRIELSGSE